MRLGNYLQAEVRACNFVQGDALPVEAFSVW
jgi:hypothetical protein